jgi:predicted DNA-binding transcriptional regulator YafY
LIEDYKSDLTGLNNDEVQALFLLSCPPAFRDLGLEQNFKSALLKLSAALPSSLRAEEQYVSQRIYIDFRSWEQRQQVSFPHLPAVLKAIRKNLILYIQYYSVVGQRIGPLEASIHPYGLVARGENWYLIGYRRDHMAVLRIDYLLDAEITREVFKIPDDFVLVEFWDQWCRESVEKRPYYSVKVRVSPRAFPFIVKYLSNKQAKQFSDLQPENLEEWVTLELQFENHEQALESLLTFGGSVKILEPIPLRFSIKDYAEQILTVYAS